MKPFTRAVLIILIIEVIIAAVTPVFYQSEYSLGLLGINFFYLALINFFVGLILAAFPATEVWGKALLLCVGLSLLLGFLTCSVSYQ